MVWSGNPNHKNDRNRSIALAELLTHLPGEFEYVSLQKDLRESDASALAANPQIRHFGEQLRDFSDTAALCELMTAVVCVDTSVAHLSAALGRPTHILLSYVTDWRWLSKRTDSPWYASARLYRQDLPGNWGSALDALRSDLSAGLNR